MSSSQGVLMRWWNLVVAFLAITLIACSSDSPADEQQDRIPYSLPGADGPRSPGAPLGESAVWTDLKAQEHITATCFARGPGDRNSQRFCVEQLMLGFDAPSKAIDFYLESDRWLVGLSDGEPLKVGMLKSPSEPHAVPQPAFLGGQPAIQLPASMFSEAFPPASRGASWPFEEDRMYPQLLSLARQKFIGADDPLELRHFEILMVEHPAGGALGTGAKDATRFVVQIGIHNFCEACGVGVAARYSFQFDNEGRHVGVELLDLCQGPLVTERVEGHGELTFHRFSGLQVGRTGANEPYLLRVPGLETCPNPVTF
jgi:hypothetical protein